MPPPDRSASAAILVVSCDKYADLWPAFLALFRRFWPDCPFPLYLVTNEAEAPVPDVVTIKVGPDRSWSANVRRALESVREDYVLMFLDDLFLVAPVDTAKVEETVREFVNLRGACLKLNPTVPGDLPGGGRFNRTSPGTAYRTSTVLTLWSKQVLHDLLLDTENAWEFELNGSERSDAYPNFFAAKAGHFSFVNGVIKGHWSRRALRTIQRLTGDHQAPARPVLSWPSEIGYQLALVRSRVFLHLTAGKNRRYHRWLRHARSRLTRRAPPARRGE